MDKGLPLQLEIPVFKANISSGFGWRMDPKWLIFPDFHEGVDIRAPNGTPVYAAAEGHAMTGSDGSRGNFVVIKHGDGKESHYYHFQNHYVGSGASVKMGQRIGAVGSTGRSTGNHLHFAIKGISGGWYDPLFWLGVNMLPRAAKQAMLFAAIGSVWYVTRDDRRVTAVKRAAWAGLNMWARRALTLPSDRF